MTALTALSMATNTARGTNTKFWNTNMDYVEADEQLYTDHKDDAQTQITNFKFKTTKDRLPEWIKRTRKTTVMTGSNGSSMILLYASRILVMEPL